MFKPCSPHILWCVEQVDRLDISVVAMRPLVQQALARLAADGHEITIVDLANEEPPGGSCGGSAGDFGARSHGTAKVSVEV